MDPSHQDPGFLDSLIRDGLLLQGFHDRAGTHGFDQLVDHEKLRMNAEMDGYSLITRDNDDVDERIKRYRRLDDDTLRNVHCETSHVNQGELSVPNGSGIRIDGQFHMHSYTPEEAAEASDNSGTVGGGDAETGSSGRPWRQRKRPRGKVAETNKQGKPSGNNMKGRFSGRLPTKEDEKRLAEECQLIAQYISHDGTLCTLPTIIRALAAGEIRKFLEATDCKMKEMERRLESQEQGQDKDALSDRVVMLQVQLQHAQSKNATLEKQVAELRGMNSGDIATNAATGRHAHMGGISTTAPVSVGQQDYLRLSEGLDTIGTAGLPQLHSYQVGNQSMSISVPQIQPNSSPLYPTMNKTASVNQLVQMGNNPAQMTIGQTENPNRANLPHISSAMTIQTQGSLQHLQNDGNVQGSMGMHQSRSTMNLQQQEQQHSSFEPQSQGIVLPSSADPAPSNEVTVGSDMGGNASIQSNLVDHAQHLVRAASLHGAAKTEAASQAQQLAVEAQKHAEASVKAAQQAEELKKTLSSLPDSDQVQQAAATVTSLEARAQVHASITTQVVAQARNLHEVAQSHQKEELKAMTQATVLQARAGSLQAPISGSASLRTIGTDMNGLPVMQTEGYTQPTLFAPTGGPTVATPTLLTSHIGRNTAGNIIENTNGTEGIAKQGVPVTSSNHVVDLQNQSVALISEEQKQHIALAQLVIHQRQQPLLNSSHIVYRNSDDPAADAAALQQQIAALHAQQPQHLVAAPPIHIADATDGNANSDAVANDLSNDRKIEVQNSAFDVTGQNVNAEQQIGNNTSPQQIVPEFGTMNNTNLQPTALPSHQIGGNSGENMHGSNAQSPVISLSDFNNV